MFQIKSNQIKLEELGSKLMLFSPGGECPLNYKHLKDNENLKWLQEIASTWFLPFSQRMACILMIYHYCHC